MTLLDEGGSGAEYTRPGGQAGQRYFKLPYSYWLGEPAPCGLLELPAKAMLLVALSLKSPFYLPLGSVPEWYGFSRDTAQRGFGELIERGLVSFHDKVVAAPLAPSGSTRRRYYSVSAALAEAIPPVG